jgi:hypothetical protein
MFPQETVKNPCPHMQSQGALRYRVWTSIMRLNCVWWRLTSVSVLYGTWFMSPFWCLEIRCGSQVFGKFVQPCLTPYRTHRQTRFESHVRRIFRRQNCTGCSWMSLPCYSKQTKTLKTKLQCNTNFGNVTYPPKPWRIRIAYLQFSGPTTSVGSTD